MKGTTFAKAAFKKKRTLLTSKLDLVNLEKWTLRSRSELSGEFRDIVLEENRKHQMDRQNKEQTRRSYEESARKGSYWIMFLKEKPTGF